MRWHCPPDLGFEIRALAVWGRARYLSITEAPHNTKFHTWMGKKHFCFFQTAETGNRTPNASVKGSGANNYPRAPAQCDELGLKVTFFAFDQHNSGYDSYRSPVKSYEAHSYWLNHDYCKSECIWNATAFQCVTKDFIHIEMHIPRFSELCFMRKTSPPPKKKYNLLFCKSFINSLTAKLFNFHRHEFVDRVSETQLQVGENDSNLTNWRSCILKSWWLMSRFIFHMLKLVFHVLIKNWKKTTLIGTGS